MFITAVIGAHKRHNVACYDIPGAFLHADVEEDITMILKGRLAELMVQVAPNLYRKYIAVDRKETSILYIKMQKVLYGLLRSALLFIGNWWPTSREMGSSLTRMIHALPTRT